jgi:hypothetical protein
LRDPELLCGEAIVGLRCSLAHRLACRPELLSCTFAPLGSTERIEQFDGPAQRRACISWTPLSPQPSAEREHRPCLQERVSGQILTERGDEDCLHLIIAGQ